MKSKLIPILLTCACASLARADFNPVTLTANSYTFDIVVESNVVQSLPDCITASVGGGTGKGDSTFFERGLYARTGGGYYCGVPLHGATFTHQNNANIQYTMPPDYTVNNGLLIDSGVTSGTLTLSSATTATNISLLGTGGGGGVTVNYTVNHLNGTTTETGSFNPGDWFGGAGAAWICGGRVGTPGGGFSAIDTSGTSLGGSSGANPRIYSKNITVSSVSPVTSISFTYSSGGGHDCFFALSCNASGGIWSPAAISGFNEMLIEPATVPFPITASMDNGTNIASPGNTWFEQGYVRGTPGVGLPPSGSIFNSVSQPTHHYQMGNYSTNNGILIDTNHQVANITPAFPTNYSAFALLTAGGNIGGNNIMTNLCILQHQDGINETNPFYGYDWFNGNISPAFIANGRVNMSDRSQNNVNNNQPRLFESYFTVADVASPVTNIVVKFQASGLSVNATTYIMALSASAGGVAPVVTSGALPATQTWYPTQTATFNVLVSGTAPVTNSWLVQQGVDISNNPIYVPLTNGVDANGSTIVGANTTTLTINNLTVPDGTNYEYIAANAIGSATSSPALLIINPGTPVAPIIDAQAPTTDFSALSNHISTFSVTIDASSAPPLFYQWYSGGIPIAGATSATYANTDTNSSTFYCIITNFVGSATSSPVAMTIFAKPALSPYQAAVFAYSPVSYWPLTETNGNTAFDYAGANDGTYTGGFILGNTGLPATAGIGANTSAGFDGSTAYVNIPRNNLNITGPLTVIAWVQQTSAQANNFETALGHSDQSYRLSSSYGQSRFADPGGDVAGPNINDGNWHQLIGVYDGTLQHLYVDGVQVGTPTTGTPPGSGYNVLIGAAPDYLGSRNWNGNIAQVAILSSALSASQILAIYQSLDTPPTVSITPASPSIFAGSSVTLTAHTNASITPATSLQWYYIDTSNSSNNITGATGSTYTIANATLAQNGYTYGVNAANAYGSGTASVVLTVQNGPAYLGGDISPLTGEAYVGAPVTYTVNAQGSLPIYYQWSVDGAPVGGATNVSYTAPAACGSHTLQVTFTNDQSGAIPVVSSVATLQGDAYPTNITFNIDGTGWQFNGGVPTIAGDILQLTDGNSDEAASVFYTVPQYVGSFTASFTYTPSGNRAADGAAFVIQNYSTGASALGGGGGGLGFLGISNSVALEINLYPGNGQNPGIAPSTNGNTFGSGGNQYQAPGLIDVTSGDPINFTLNWANGVMTVTVTDATTLNTYTTNYVFGSLTSILGGTDLGYVGFTGADGGATSIQTISNFEFHSVIAPVALSVSPVTAGSFTISWPAADPSYVLQTTSTLTPPSWGAGPTPTVVGGVNQATVNVTSGSQHQFYRLVRVVCQ